MDVLYRYSKLHPFNMYNQLTKFYQVVFLCHRLELEYFCPLRKTPCVTQCSPSLSLLVGNH